MWVDQYYSKKKLPADFLTRKSKPTAKGLDKIVLLPFSGEYYEELLTWLEKDQEVIVMKEFLYGCKTNAISEENLRDLFSNYYYSNQVYKAFRVCIKTAYKVVIPIGNVQLTMKRRGGQCYIRKFYLDKIWRRSGYEHKSLVTIIKYAFESLGCTKVVISVFATNEYYVQYLQETGFKLSK